MQAAAYATALMAPEGAVQTLGGRRRGGTSVLAATGDDAGINRDADISKASCSPVRGGTSCWKHLTMHVLMSGQTFCGQYGQGVGADGLWQGISSAADWAAWNFPAIDNA